MNNVEQTTVEIIGKDLATAAFKAVEAGFNSMVGSLSSFTGVAGAVIDGLGKIGLAAQGIEAVGKSAVGMGNALIQGNASLEMTTISFKTLLGSAGAADDMIKQLTTFAEATPFELKGLEASTQRLLAFGFSSKEIIPLMTSMGDAISALGGTQQNLDSLVYVMGQMHAEAHLNAGDIMQMTNLGIPALQMLADHYKVTTGEMQTMISKGLVPGTEAVQVFKDGMETKYGGMMVAQSATFTGMMSNLHDWAAATTITLTKPFFAPAKEGLQKLLDFVQSPAGVAAVNKLAGYIQEGVDKLTALFIKAIPHIRAFKDQLVEMAGHFRSNVAPSLGVLWEKLEPLALTAIKLYETFSPLAIGFRVLEGLLTGGLPGAAAAFNSSLVNIFTTIKSIVPIVLEGLTYVGKIILGWIVQYGPVLLNQLATWAMAFVEWIAPVAAMMVTKLLAVGARLIQWIAGYAPVILNQLFYWTTAFVSWIAPAIPLVIEALAGLLKQVVSYIIASIPLILNAFDSLTSSLGIHISGPIQLVSNLFTNVLVPALGLAVKFVFEHFIPALNLVSNSISTNIVPAIQGLVASIYNNLVPVFDVFARTMAVTVMPVLGFLIGILNNVLIPAFARVALVILTQVIPPVAAFVMSVVTTLIPVFNAVVNTIVNSVIPALLFVGSTLSLVFGPAFRLIAGIIANEFLPWVDAVWKKFDEKFGPAIKEAAAKLGDKLAVEVQKVSNKIKEMAPHVQAMIDKFAPFAKKAGEVAEAVSPLSTALAVLGGFLTGGPAGAVESFKERLEKLKKVTGIDLLGAFDKVKGFVETTLIPIFKNIVSFVETTLIPIFKNLVSFVETTLIPIFKNLTDFFTMVLVPAFKTIAAIFTDTVIPAVKEFAKWINDHILPIFKSIGDTLETTVFPALKRFGEFIMEKVVPALKEVFTWVGEKVVPLIETLASVWTNQVIPVLGTVVAFVMDHMIPVLFEWWKIIATFLRPIFEALGWVITNIIAPAFKWAVDYISNQIIPRFIELSNFIQDNVMPVLKNVAGILGNTVVGAFNLVSLAVSMIMSVFGTMGTVIGGIINGIGNAVGWLYNNAIMPIFNAIGTALGVVGGFFQGLWDNIVRIWNGITGFLGGAAKGIGNIFIGALNIVLDIVNGVIDIINNAIRWGKSLPWAGELVKGVSEVGKIPLMQQFAKGTMNAPGGMSLVGEAGMEMLRLPGGRNMLASGPTILDLPRGSQVIPLTGQYAGSGTGAVGGGNFTNTFNISVTAAPGSDARALGEQIAKVVEEKLRNVGGGVQANRNYGARGIA